MKNCFNSQYVILFTHIMLKNLETRGIFIKRKKECTMYILKSFLSEIYFS